MKYFIVFVILFHIVPGSFVLCGYDDEYCWEGHTITIITDIDAVKPAQEWFCFTEIFGDFVVLTFDDGPFRHVNNGSKTDHTDLILDILKREGLEATFFILGFQLDTDHVKTGETYQKYCQWLSRMFLEGHTVAIHDRNHIQFYKQSQADMDASFFYTQGRVSEICGQKLAPYVRSPGGTISREVAQYLKERGYRHVFWHINSEPEPRMSSREILDAIIKDINRGKRGIIMMHDRNASEYLDELLKFLSVTRIGIISLEEWERRYGLPETPLTLHRGKFK